MKPSSLSEGNRALRNKQFELALHHYLKAKQTMPEIAHLIQANIKLVTRRLDGAPVSQADDQVIGIDIVVPVFNALSDVKDCLASLQNHTDGFQVRVIVVNDGSDEATTQWLREFCEGKQIFSLIEHPTNSGYTRAVNTGLKASTAPYVITQNSDTIVSNGWLTGLIRCMRSAPNVGIVGPLSNAASWQNVPALRDATGSFAVNDLPAGLDVDAMARTVAQASIRAYPRLPFVNGFCFMISRAVIEAVGYMDELNFPVGYGEENDFCIRAQDAGFELAIADDVFVFHAKSKSFGHERRKTLSEQGTRSLKNKHTVEKYQARVETVKKTEALDNVRARIQSALEQGRSHDSVA
jgi:GT2 family glycosyltransferase